MNYLVIGAGPAGSAAAEAIREADSEGTITMISEEPLALYSKPLITDLLAQKIQREQIRWKGENFCSAHRIHLQTGKRATRLDIPRKEVVVNGGERIGFDRLLIATGGRPIALSIPGVELPGVFSFTRLSDADALAQFMRSRKAKSAVVIGGGMIGLKATEALLEQGLEVSIVEMADRLLAATFDRPASSIVEEALQKKGCQVFLQNTATQILSGRSGQVEGVMLKDRKKLPCHLVIFAIGVTPNIDLAREAAITCHRGIRVDSTMQTSQIGIYAAGDCCEMQDFFGGGPRVIAIWPNAVRQGKVAGHNMAGQKDRYEGSLAMNAVEIGGVASVSVGMTDPEGEGYEIRKIWNPQKSIYKKLVLKEEVIVGAIFVGDMDRAGIYTGLIRNRVPVSDFKEHLLKEDFGLIYLPQAFRKHLVTGEGMEV